MPIPVQCVCGASFMATDEVAGTNQNCPTCGGVILVPFPPAAPVPAQPSPVPTQPAPIATQPVVPVAQPAVPVAQPVAPAQPFSGPTPASVARPIAAARPSRIGYWIAMSVGIFVIFIALVVVFVVVASGGLSSPTGTVNSVVKHQRSGNYRKLYAALTDGGQRVWFNRLLYEVLLKANISEEKTPTVMKVLTAHVRLKTKDLQLLVSRFRSAIKRKKEHDAIAIELAEALVTDMPEKAKDLYFLPETTRVVSMKIDQRKKMAMGTVEYTLPKVQGKITRRVRLRFIEGGWRLDQMY